MSIRLKLVLGFNLVLAALALLGFFAFRDLIGASDSSGYITSILLLRAEDATHLAQEVSRLRTLEMEYLHATDSDKRRQAAASLTDSVRRLQTYIEPYQALAREERDTQIASLLTAYGAYLALHQRMLTLAEAGRTGEALALYELSAPAFRSLEDQVHALRHQAFLEVSEASGDVDNALERTRYLLLGGLAATAALIFAIGHPLSTYIHRRLQTLLEGTDRVRRGDFSQRLPTTGRDEFGRVARAFNEMVDSLQEARDQVAELHAQALRSREERIARLQEDISQVVRAQEEERLRVARELHDQAGQPLAILQLRLSRLEQNAAAADVRDQLSTLRNLTLETINIIRNLALDLRPATLDELGLVPALRDYVKTFAGRLGIPVEFRASGLSGRLPAEMEVTLFRIAQEGLTNIAKHAQASRASITLEAEGAQLTLSVEDDGVGFDVEAALGPDRHRSLGLFGIWERSQLLGGNMQIFSRPGRGTRLVVTVPLVGATAPSSDPAATQ